MKRIRITGPGIHGAPTDDNPTGEYPIGYEFDTASDLPAGWIGRAVIVGEEPKEGSSFVVGQHETSTREIVERAEKAEADLRYANEQISALNLKLAAFERSGTGHVAETATVDEIKSAVALLDGKIDAHWTTTGLPAVDAVAELTGKSVTRKAIEEAAPGTKRPA